MAGNVSNVVAAAEEAKNLAKGAGTAASFAALAAQSAADSAALARGTAETQGKYFRFTPQGAFIGRPGGKYELGLSDDGITFTEAGTVVSLWDAGRMIVTEFIGETVTLANHKLESRGTRTIVRSL